MNSKLFESINDRGNIISAYSKMISESVSDYGTAEETNDGRQKKLDNTESEFAPPSDMVYPIAVYDDDREDSWIDLEDYEAEHAKKSTDCEFGSDDYYFNLAFERLGTDGVYGKLKEFGFIPSAQELERNGVLNSEKDIYNNVVEIGKDFENGLHENDIEVSVPSWALSYLVNNDDSGLSEEEKDMIDKWEEGYVGQGYEFVYDGKDLGFTPHPDFGPADDCVRCYFVKSGTEVGESVVNEYAYHQFTVTVKNILWSTENADKAEENGYDLPTDHDKIFIEADGDSEDDIVTAINDVYIDSFGFAPDGFDIENIKKHGVRDDHNEFKKGQKQINEFDGDDADDADGDSEHIMYADFVEKYCDDHGDNWANMILSGIKKLFPDVFEKLDTDNRQYTFLELAMVLQHLGIDFGDVKNNNGIPNALSNTDDDKEAYEDNIGDTVGEGPVKGQFFDENGYLAKEIPEEAVKDCSQHGKDVYEECSHWVDELGFADGLDIEKAKEYLRHTGAWSKEELDKEDAKEIAIKVLWIVCSDINENGKDYPISLGESVKSNDSVKTVTIRDVQKANPDKDIIPVDEEGDVDSDVDDNGIIHEFPKTTNKINRFRQKFRINSEGESKFDELAEELHTALDGCTNGLFSDNNYEVVNTILKKIEDLGLFTTITKVENYGMRPSDGLRAGKKYHFDASWTNKFGKRMIVHGIITIAFAGTMEDPEKRYDACVYFFTDNNNYIRINC